ncbi:MULTISPECIES: FHA domain-containing protein [Rhodococcus]|uniref:Possible forkhead associated domain n=2 Tax=Rhodococcus jostii TaxID=132919 RepID=Q0S229_RHOJR|nr:MULTISPECIES: FHA domain-containing protein [Rhodococcus]ABG98407.1 possible forkhead associated domain [Rhodococcus jostii RHA1]MDH6292754.1 pSer/pThr/pTyr-binding forkhead associated (FHA) protein [Rhodococcus opacus]MDI9952828.1 FHA domain-containing protein [Rhodococcus sp. IEGM 1305]MDI9977697.1 FHA domain-containing protein [Rhodococcus sp. IEGM 1307]MDV6286198.1 FHA domain-containing protein [Rhodococcus jostii]
MEACRRGVAVDRAVESRLSYSDREGHHHTVDLSPTSARVTIGRSPGSDLLLTEDDEVSRLHAVLECVGSHWTILDDGLSRNGTFVNGERLAGRRRLRQGDSIRIGGTKIRYLEFGGSLDEATRMGTDMPDVRSLTDTQRAVLTALCRPYKHGAAFANPASNQQIAQELFLSVDAIKTHLRALFAKFGVGDLPQNQKRVSLAERAMRSGIINERDL